MSNHDRPPIIRIRQDPGREEFIALMQEVFPGSVVLCSCCETNPAPPDDSWCNECSDGLRSLVGPYLVWREPRPLPPAGHCGSCGTRPAINGHLCGECTGGVELGQIGVPLSDTEVREFGFIPTARGWVARSQELRERLALADQARLAHQEYREAAYLVVRALLAERRRSR